MVVKNRVPYCDYCHREMEAKTEEECLGDIIPHGWDNWRDAQVHCCFACSDGIWQPPCEECNTHPCEKGRDCWASPPLHLLPYETYYANALGEDYMPTVDLDEDDPDGDGLEADSEEEKTELDAEVRRRQLMKLAGMQREQLPIILFLPESK